MRYFYGQLQMNRSKRNSPSPAHSANCSKHTFFEFIGFFVLRRFPEYKKVFVHRFFLCASVRWLWLQRNCGESGIPLSLEKHHFSSELGSKRNSPKPAPSVDCSEHTFFIFVQFFVLRWLPKHKQVFMHNHQKIRFHTLLNPIRRALALPLMFNYIFS